MKVYRVYVKDHMQLECIVISSKRMWAVEEAALQCFFNNEGNKWMEPGETTFIVVDEDGARTNHMLDAIDYDPKIYISEAIE